MKEGEQQNIFEAWLREHKGLALQGGARLHRQRVQAPTPGTGSSTTFLDF